MGWGAKAMPRPLYTRETNPIPIVQKDGPGWVWKSSPLSGIRSRDRQDRSVVAISTELSRPTKTGSPAHKYYPSYVDPVMQQAIAATVAAGLFSMHKYENKSSKVLALKLILNRSKNNKTGNVRVT